MNASKRVVLIVSTGRTGTKAIAHHLSSCYPDIRAVHEPSPTRFRLRRAANRYLSGHATRAELARILALHRDHMLTETPQAVYVESNPALSGFLDVFGELFEDFRVLHVVRDPATYITSSINWGVFRGIKRWLAEFLPYWLPKADVATSTAPLRAQLALRPWSRMSAVERLAWHWAMINRHLDRGHGLYADRYRRIRYEDLFARDGAGLRTLTDWLGLPSNDALLREANREPVNASKNRGFPGFDEWPASDQEAMLRQCCELMTEYGYLHPGKRPSEPAAPSLPMPLLNPDRGLRSAAAYATSGVSRQDP